MFCDPETGDVPRGEPEGNIAGRGSRNILSKSSRDYKERQVDEKYRRCSSLRMWRCAQRLYVPSQCPKQRQSPLKILKLPLILRGNTSVYLGHLLNIPLFLVSPL